ncbi:SMB domain-containing protein [Meloidogyne graminicola]|uniref:SMB domain-containing protein n=1 Tax=Meloidogyne graminicola TaxID=189291 RepID=A0A8S9ZQ78_9BILA|nr:SMB domain-containing protein [Meloidogyne graminicola]
MFGRESFVFVAFATQQIYFQRLLFSTFTQILFLLICSLMAEYNNNNNQNFYTLLFGCSLVNQQPLCCSGKNSSCKSREHPTRISTIYKFNVNPSDISPVYCRPKRKAILNKKSTKYSFPLPKELWRRIMQRQTKIRLHKYFSWFNSLNENYLRLFELSKPKKKRGKRKKRLSKDQTEKINFNELPKVLNNDLVFQFGWPVEYWDIENYDKLITDDQGWPLIRYSLLNKYLPLKVLKRSHTIDSVKGRQRQYWHTFNVEDSPKECFCDQLCVKYGDCCSDYTQRCPVLQIVNTLFGAKFNSTKEYKNNSICQNFKLNSSVENFDIEFTSDCLISQWTSWSDCMVEMPNVNCGIGFRERNRQILKHEENGGLECPTELKQEIGCFKQCEANIEENIKIDEEEEFTRPDITTVALLLDYKFNNSRKFLPRHLKRNQIGFIRRVKPNLQYKKYCVIYTIEWLNRNCIEFEWRDKLATKQRICAECQPEAQYHRPRARCASDLEDGQTGFWKLIGPKSCYGIWRRHYSDTNNCNCSQSYSQFQPFLLKFTNQNNLSIKFNLTPEN